MGKYNHVAFFTFPTCPFFLTFILATCLYFAHNTKWYFPPHFIWASFPHVHVEPSYRWSNEYDTHSM